MRKTSPTIIAVMTGIALALSGCRVLSGGSAKADGTLVKAEEKLQSLSYTAEVTEKNKKYHCEALFRSDGAVRRTWNWDENGQKHSYAEVMSGSKGHIVTDDGKLAMDMTSEQMDSLQFFSDLFLRPRRALTITDEMEDSRQIVSDGFRCCKVRTAYRGFKDASLIIAKDTGFWSTLFLNKQDGSETRIQFTEYQKLGESYFPTKIVTNFNGSETTAAIRDVKFNPELADDLFELQTK